MLPNRFIFLDLPVLSKLIIEHFRTISLSIYLPKMQGIDIKGVIFIKFTYHIS